MRLVFKIGAAKKDGRSEIALVLGKDRIVTENSDNVLSALDKLLKKNRIKIGDIKDVKLEVSKKAGLTSQRIIKSIIKALTIDPV